MTYQSFFHGGEPPTGLDPERVERVFGLAVKLEELLTQLEGLVALKASRVQQTAGVVIENVVERPVLEGTKVEVAIVGHDTRPKFELDEGILLAQALLVSPRLIQKPR